MKMTCELVVFELLPTARGEIAKELVKAHGFTQTRVAKLFGVTSAAVSQYIKGLRGGNIYIERSMFRSAFYTRINEIADSVANGGDLTEELCELCRFVKRIGMLDEIYKMQGSLVHAAACMECPKKNIAPSV